MNQDDRDIDTLLQRNAEQQLADFDWEGFSAGIGRCLTAARVGASLRPRSMRWVAVAAAVGLTAGLIGLAALMVNRAGPAPVPGTASVVMLAADHPTGRAQAVLNERKRTARCEVTLTTVERPRQSGPVRASWFLVAKHESTVARDAMERRALDVVCLF